MEDVILTHERFAAADGTGASGFTSNVYARREPHASGFVLHVSAASLPGIVPRAGDRFHGRDILTAIEASLTGRGEYRCVCVGN